MELEKLNRTSSRRPKKVCSIKTLFTCHINLNHQWHFVQLVGRPISFCEKTTLQDEEKKEEKVPIQSIYNPFQQSIHQFIVYWSICNQGRLAYDKDSAKPLHDRARANSNKRMADLEEEEEPKRKITRASLKWWRMFWLLEAGSPLYDIVYIVYTVIPFSPMGFFNGHQCFFFLCISVLYAMRNKLYIY